jgi:hypothetical protein
MTITDWIGFTGVGILLLAYFLTLVNKTANNSFLYLGLNILGAGIACYASIRLAYWPFILLEGIWTLVSLFALIKIIYTKKTT